MEERVSHIRGLMPTSLLKHRGDFPGSLGPLLPSRRRSGRAPKQRLEGYSQDRKRLEKNSREVLAAC